MSDVAILIPVAILLISRLLPFIRFGEFPLGVDAGIYLKDFQPLPPALVFSLYILTNLFLTLMIYLTAKEFFGKEAAFFSLLIFSLSAAQFLFYWTFFWKMTLAAAITLGVFLFLKKRNWAAAPLAAAVGIIHAPTLLPLLIALLPFFLGPAVIALVASVLARPDDFLSFLFYGEQYLRGGYSTDLAKLLVGHFVGFDFYGNFLAIGYLPFGLLGMVRLLNNKSTRPLLLYFLINMALVQIGFLFQNRFLILLDLTLIIFSGAVLKDFVYWFWQNKAGQTTVLAALVLAAAALFYQVWLTEPAITQAELQVIKSFRRLQPDLPIVTDGLYYPILAAYSGHQVITWDNWNEKEGAFCYLGRRSPEKLSPDISCQRLPNN